MELWIGALNLGFLYSFMAMGVYLTFRIHDFPDITVDGSLTTGAAVSAVLLVTGMHPLLVFPFAFGAGAIAGVATAMIHTRFHINGLLSGILVMTGLYSINLHIMGQSNIPLLREETFFSWLNAVNPGFRQEIWLFIILLVVIFLFWLLFSYFFKTDLGITMRATGNNSVMVSASGVNVDLMKIFGIALSNGLVGLSGCLVAQYQGFADIGMGIGAVVFGLASVIIGESIVRSRSVQVIVLSVIAGSIVFRLMVALALYVGLNPIDLKLITAIFVLVTLIFSRFMAKGAAVKKKEWSKGFVYGFICIAILSGGYIVWKEYGTKNKNSARRSYNMTDRVSGETSDKPAEKRYKIGLVQIVDHAILNLSRDTYREELKRLGYIEGVNLDIDLKNAHGDIASVNTILDSFVNDEVDLVLTISTPCTQAAINKIKDRPVVFTTVSNPFVINAGENDVEHLPNVTGVYGWVPMEKLMDIVATTLPDFEKIGILWNESQANSVFNVKMLKKVLKEQYPEITYFPGIVSNASEVYEHALSFASKGIDAFVLPPDNTVYSAVDAVVKVAENHNIPIFMSDILKAENGVLASVGYNYVLSGIQAARLTDKILRKGENPKDIPFQRYTGLETTVNLDIARKLNISIPEEFVKRADIVIDKGNILKRERRKKVGIVQFALEPNVERAKKGILAALEDNGYFDGVNIDIIYKNANADFPAITSIIQDLMRREVDIIVPLSTPVVQASVQQAHHKRGQKIVFTYIFDPYRIGAAKSPTDHLPNMTGVSSFPPIEKMLDLIKDIFPDRNKIGVVWNSSEANSESVLLKARAYAKTTGQELMEATVSNPTEVLDASRALAAKGADVFLNPGDNTLNVSYDSFAKTANENSIPLFTIDPDFIDNHTLAALGPDYYVTGYEGGQVVVKVLNGENIADIPVTQTKETVLFLNLDTARTLGLSIPQRFIKRADKVIDSQRSPPVSAKEESPKTMAILQFSDHYILDIIVEGVFEYFNEKGILAEYNLSVDRLNSQGDFGIARTIAQDIVRKKYDYVMTVSTPSLQVVANTNKTIPHIFGGVTSPYKAGVADTPEKHQENLTGVATPQPVAASIQAMRELFPKAKTIGLVWNPAEANSEVCTINAREAAKKYGFDLMESTVSSTGEVMEAVNSLIIRGIDIFLTSGDNTVILAVESVADLMKRKKIPYFTNSSTDIEKGAFVSIGADYREVGVEAGRIAERVIKGEKTSEIPIKEYVPEEININLSMADLYGITVSEEFLKRCSKVISEKND